MGQLLISLAIAFSQADDGDGYRTLGQYFSVMPSALSIQTCYRICSPGQ